MTTMREILNGLIGLFLDDEFLAVAILAVVAVTALLSLGFETRPWWTGAFLLVSIVFVLAGSVLRTARKSARRN
ncbi:hypothetical protein [Hyphomicrobium sp. 99]|uniref:hypothetical protein n=1 Tax=Hyphomicrobium sp. 99 TaxID=1163419 RepID=UPI0005F86BFF|nr:hypothetical protein [Hyphomicrobium sp. 99]